MLVFDAEHLALALTAQQRRVVAGMRGFDSFMPLRVTGQRLLDAGIIAEGDRSGWAHLTPLGLSVKAYLSLHR